ncbi:hypothetical protein P3T21_007502 [Paraburkholderia sp. GAS334]
MSPLVVGQASHPQHASRYVAASRCPDGSRDRHNITCSIPGTARRVFATQDVGSQVLQRELKQADSSALSLRPLRRAERDAGNPRCVSSAGNGLIAAGTSMHNTPVSAYGDPATLINGQAFRWRQTVRALDACGDSRDRASGRSVRCPLLQRDRASGVPDGANAKIEIPERLSPLTLVLSWRDPIGCSY